MTLQDLFNLVSCVRRKSAKYQEFSALLSSDLQLDKLGRLEFYRAARDPDTALVIATGEQRVYANLLLTSGAIPLA